MTSVPPGRLPRGANPWPWTGSGYGPLPPLLVVLTIVTGLVDAVSYVALGHVFVANMTGNVVFLGFALAGAPGLSAVASLVALGGFALGALAGGRIATRLGRHRGWHLRTATAAAFVLVAIAVVLSAIAGQPVSQDARYSLIVVLALAMGLQNATARRLAVPDLTTTVLTLTVTGIAADSHLAGGGGGRPARRLISVGAMLAGALVGALLVLHVSLVLPLAVAGFLMLGVAVGAHLFSSTDAPWAHPAPSKSPGVALAAPGGTSVAPDGHSTVSGAPTTQTHQST
jgi:uncharacterized membrane protein YoaK (UPF0700 family)